MPKGQIPEEKYKYDQRENLRQRIDWTQDKPESGQRN